MATEYDRYREALVIENYTTWPEEYRDLEPAERRRLEEKLHADPAKAADLKYERLHTGFARVIAVTPADLARVKK